jgi:hypothetical protein
MRTAWILISGAWALFSTIGCDGATGGGCEDDADCAGGRICSDNTCVEPSQGQGDGSTGAVDGGPGAEADAGGGGKDGGRDGGRDGRDVGDDIEEDLGRFVDPGTDPFQAVPREQVAEVCKMSPGLLDAADAQIKRPWLVVRYGRLCHQSPEVAEETPDDLQDVVETLIATVAGVASWQTRAIPRTGRGTGQLSDEDPVYHWIDPSLFEHARRYSEGSLVAHMLSMTAYNDLLDFGAKDFILESWEGLMSPSPIVPAVEVVSAAIAQHSAWPELSALDFMRRFLFEPLGMAGSIEGGTGYWEGLVFSVDPYWKADTHDMARLGLLLLNGGAWNGKRVLSKQWVYRMTHPAFEDANCAYGYLTWLNSRSNSVNESGERYEGPHDRCSPAALWNAYPHPPSQAPDCNYNPPYTCEQQYDVGVWYTPGNNLIVGHRGLDMVLVVRDHDGDGPGSFWRVVRPAVIALDPVFPGDEVGFCTAYGSNSYAPDLVEW